MIYCLKTFTNYFQAVADGTKTFEVRQEDDKSFSVGDTLILQEIDMLGNYTGSEVTRVVTFCLRERTYVPEGYVILGLKDSVNEQLREQFIAARQREVVLKTALERLRPVGTYLKKELPDSEVVNLVTTVGALRQVVAVLDGTVPATDHIAMMATAEALGGDKS